jgi:16S rRNA (cytidine1402-2'-O)-methyltransferase
MQSKETSLYLVPTPIGNLEDITFRAIATLKKVDAVLAEDTRNTIKLLSHFEIRTKLEAYHAHNEHKAVERIVARLENGEKLALVSDAGTPAISDPGFLIVREALKKGIQIECLPGATAFVPALVKSGLPSDRFCFEGFLPHKKGRQTKLTELAKEERTIVLYESTHRIIKLLEQIVEFFGAERPVSVSRELTKIHEETVNGTATEVLTYYQKAITKGEFVVVIGGFEG